MHSAPHRNNSDFQLRHFIAGSCHTPDAAWNVMYEQLIDIKVKLASTRAALLRRQARAEELETALKVVSSEPARLRALADIEEFNAGEGLLELAIQGGEREIDTIQSIMDELEPQRKYAHLPLLEATEASQRDEWREEFKYRIENYVASQGMVPHDQLDAMRKHPDFETDILPHMKKSIACLESSRETGDILLPKKQMLLAYDGDGDGK